MSEALFQFAVKKLSPDFEKLLAELKTICETAQVEKGGWVILKFEKDHPQLSAAIRALFQGTPEELREKLSGVLPWAGDVPLEVWARLQVKLLNEWERPR